MTEHPNHATYIRDHYERDITLNKELADIDVSAQLGSVLAHYLSMVGEDAGSFTQYGLKSMNQVKLDIQRTTGHIPHFLEIWKCGLVVHTMIKEGDLTGLEQLLQYSTELLRRGLNTLPVKTQ